MPVPAQRGLAARFYNGIFLNNFGLGLVNRVEKEDIPRGAASDVLNWHFLGDRVELRRGQKRVGALVDGDGRVTFVRVLRTYDGTEIPFFGFLRKFLHYDAGTDTNVEIGSDMLPAAASGEDIAATAYQSLAGSFGYFSSPNSSVYKVPVANPGSLVDQLQDTFRGYIKTGVGRLFLWNRKDKYGGADKTGLYVSTIDRDSLADYDFTSGEGVGTGDGSTTAFSGTLAFKAANAKKTCHFARIAASTSALASVSALTQNAAPLATTSASHGLAVGDVVVFQGLGGMVELNHRIAVVATVPLATTFTFDIDTSGFTAYTSGGSVGKAELFTDDRIGGLSGNQGGTGTIDYGTGAFAVTFATAPVNTAAVASDYYTEDSTNQGILDFNQGDGTTIADSLTFRQDDAGFFQNLGVIGEVIFCLHTIKTYALRLISSDDITNLPYRNKVGTPNWRGSCETGEGVYYVDLTDPQKPTVRILETTVYSAEVIPQSISENLDLTGYVFDAAVVFAWGDYICVACRTQDETANNRLLMYSRSWKSWEVHSFRVSDMDTYNGALLGGDSASCNLYTLFSGVADEDAAIENYLIFSNDELDKNGIKDVRRMKLAGMIGDDQQINISYSVDNAPFVLATTVLGTGPYVDSNERKVIGSTTLGQETIGGGEEAEDAIFASPYEVEFFVGTPRFQRIRIKVEATQVGYASIAELGYLDIRDKGRRLPVKYTA